MSPCNRFEEEGLEAEVLPEALAQHLDACEACRQAQGAYAEFLQLMRECQTSSTLPLSWKENVWRIVEAQGGGELVAAAAPKPAPRASAPPVPTSWWERWRMAMQPRHWAFGGFASAALVAALVFSLYTATSTSHYGPSLSPTAFVWSLHDADSAPIRMSDGAQLGNQIYVEALIPEASQAALFVYLQNRLVFSCSSGSLGEHCHQAQDRLKAQVVLDKVGTYRALWVVSFQPLSMPEQGFDMDAAAFLRTGASLQLPFAVEVH